MGSSCCSEKERCVFCEIASTNKVYHENVNSYRHFCKKKKVDSFRYSRIKTINLIWWSRGESNPCPKATWKELLRVQFVIYIPSAAREQTPLRHQQLHNAWYAQSFAYARAPLKSHPSPARGPSGADGRLIRQPLQRNCCQINLKSTRFIVVRRHDPLFQPHYPRRNQYGPVLEVRSNREEVRSCFEVLPKAPLCKGSCQRS